MGIPTCNYKNINFLNGVLNRFSNIMVFKINNYKQVQFSAEIKKTKPTPNTEICELIKVPRYAYKV